MPIERQTNFSAGELSPTMWGRTDLDRYRAGARTIKNFIVTPHGVLKNRSGTQYVGNLHRAGLGADEQRRIWPFVFSDTDNLILVLYANFLEIWREDQTDGRFTFERITTDGGGPLMLQTPYAAADLFTLQFAQVGDIVTITSHLYKPHELTRVSNNAWGIKEIDYDLPAFPVQVTGDLGRLGETPYDIAIPNLPPAIYFPNSEASRNAGRDGDPWEWRVSFVMQDSSGLLYETQAWGVNRVFGRFVQDGGDVIAIFEDAEVTVGTAFWDAHEFVEDETFLIDDTNPADVYVTRQGNHVSDNPNNTDTVVASRIYRGQNGLFGFMGQTTGVSYRDTGGAPDYTNPPRSILRGQRASTPTISARLEPSPSLRAGATSPALSRTATESTVVELACGTTSKSLSLPLQTMRWNSR
jgi:hypothetical protein